MRAFPQVSLNGIEEYSRGVRSFYKQGAAVGEIVCTAVTAPDTITVVWRNYGTVNIGPGFDLAPYLARHFRLLAGALLLLALPSGA